MTTAARDRETSVAGQPARTKTIDASVTRTVERIPASAAI
jgi:hypothetical protein